MNGQVPAEDGLHTAGALNTPKALNGAAPRVTVDKGVPLPPLVAGRHAKYPWRTMEVGDSFVFPGARSGAGASIVNGAKATGFKFTQRVVTENGERVVRIWRVA